MTRLLMFPPMFVSQLFTVAPCRALRMDSWRTQRQCSLVESSCTNASKVLHLHPMVILKSHVRLRGTGHWTLYQAVQVRQIPGWDRCDSTPTQ